MWQEYGTLYEWVANSDSTIAWPLDGHSRLTRHDQPCRMSKAGLRWSMGKRHIGERWLSHRNFTPEYRDRHSDVLLNDTKNIGYQIWPKIKLPLQYSRLGRFCLSPVTLPPIQVKHKGEALLRRNEWTATSCGFFEDEPSRLEVIRTVDLDTLLKLPFCQWRTIGGPSDCSSDAARHWRFDSFHWYFH